MRNLNRLIAVALSAMMVFGAGISANASQADAAGDKYQKAASFLQSIGILSVGQDGFQPEENMTRAEFAAVAVNMLGLGNNAVAEDGQSPFTDVAADNPAFGSIMTAYRLGILSGYDDNTFRPDDTLTYMQTVKILVTVLGYDVMAKAKGGYPTGYLIVAAQEGVTKGVESSMDQPVTNGVMAMLVKNTLEADAFEQTSYGSKTEYRSKNSLLYTRLNIVKASGQITANRYTSLTGSSGIAEDEIEIEGVAYKVGNTNSADLIGYTVDYYYKDDVSAGEKTLQYVALKEEQNKVLKISADDFDSYDGNTRTIKYFNRNKTEEETIAGGAAVIYNGEAVGGIGSLLPGSFDSGNILLIDSDGDGRYDVVNITSYETYAVQDVDTANYIVYDKYDASKQITLENEGSIQVIIKDTNGSPLEITDINPWDIVSVAVSRSGNLKKAVVSSGWVNDVINEVRTGDDYSDFVLLIGDKEYKTTKEFYQAASGRIKAGDQAEFYLNVEGKIAAADIDFSSDFDYGYLIKYAETVDISRAYEFKILTKSGEVKVFRSADKIEIDGEAGVSHSDVDLKIKRAFSSINTDVSRGMLIRYKTNEGGNLNAIDTLYYNPAFERAETVHRLTQNTADTSLRYKAMGQTFDGVFNINKNTVVFVVPDDNLENVDDEDLSVKTASYFTNDTEYDNIEAYTSNPDFLMSEALIRRIPGGDTSDFNNDSKIPVTLVNKVSVIVNKDGDMAYRFSGINCFSGATVTVDSKDASQLGDLRAGDIIRYSTNETTGLLENYQILYDVSRPEDKSYLPAANPYYLFGNYTDQNFGYSSQFRVVYGIPYVKDTKGYLQIVPGTDHAAVTDATSRSLYNGNLFKIYVLDRSNLSLGFQKGTLQDVRDYKHCRDNYSKVFVYTWWAEPKALVVIK